MTKRQTRKQQQRHQQRTQQRTQQQVPDHTDPPARRESGETVLHVGGASPYDVVVGHGLSGRLPAVLGESVERVAVLYAGTLGELAECEGVRPPTVTAAVGRLEEQGLVTRRPDPDDRRVARVLITREGRRLLARNRSRKTAYLAKRLAALDADERARLESAVGVLERILEQEPAP